MQANEFEKQMQTKLGDFQLDPSASVWEKVEQQIREKKRRRIIFFIIMPLVIGIAGFSLYQFTSTNDTPGQVVEVKEENEPGTNSKSDATESKKLPVVISEEVYKTKEPSNKEIVKTQTTPNSSLNDDGSTKTITVLKPGNKLIRVNNNKINSLTKKDDSPVENSGLRSTPPTKDIAKASDVVIEIKENKDIYSKKNPQIGDTSINIGDKIIVPVKIDSAYIGDSAAAQNIKDPIPGKKSATYSVKWGVEISAGISANQGRLLSFGSAHAMDQYSSPVNGGTGSPATIIPPSTISAGPGFSAGLIMEWQVSKRSRISSGLQYNYASNQIKTGKIRDTLLWLQNSFFSAQVDRVYTGSQKTNYTNSYHFITIPVWYHWQINKGVKLPIQWNVGIDISYLAATNALVYDPGFGGIYYRNKDAFTRMHFNLGTGLSFRLGGKNKKEWTIGPEVSFDMSRLVKGNDKQYLLYGGMNVKLLLSKKKK